jgi:hypothetical protein
MEEIPSRQAIFFTSYVYIGLITDGQHRSGVTTRSRNSKMSSTVTAR